MSRAYRLLNVEGRWTGARLDGLGIGADGALALPPGLGRAGSFVAAPATYEQVTEWGLVRAEVANPGVGHLQLATCSTDLDAQPPPLPSPARGPVGGSATTPAGQWRVAPRDGTVLLGLCAPARALWVGGWLYADSSGSPALRQIRVEAADDSWLDLLPSIYRRDPDGRRFLSQLLALLRSAVTVQEDRLAELPRLLDPAAAPDSGDGHYGLERLAGWVGVQLSEAESDDAAAPARRRRLVASAVSGGGLRGTRAGLAAAVLDATGVPVEVTEPGTWCSLWFLGGGSRLGVDTMLPVANPEGAVLGSSATLGAADLVDSAAYGAPALRALGGRVTVATTAAELGSRREQVAAVLDAERPAYAQVHLCAVEPRMRVGAQSRVGIDTVVAGPNTPATTPASSTQEMSR